MDVRGHWWKEDIFYLWLRIVLANESGRYKWDVFFYSRDLASMLNYGLQVLQEDIMVNFEC